MKICLCALGSCSRTVTCVKVRFLSQGWPGSTPVSTVLRESVRFSIISNIFLIKRKTFQVEI